LSRHCRLVLSVLWVAMMAAPASASHVTAGPALTTPLESAKRLVDDGDPPLFVDLRPADEFRKSRLPGARSVPLTELRRRHRDIPRTGRVVLYCACPSIEVHAAYQFLRDEGYRNVTVMEEGFPGWAMRGYPLDH
jgi:rhodanese-related sulfurtransferase